MAKIYLNGCSAKGRTNTFGNLEIRLGLKVEDLAEFCRKHKNERGYLNLVIAERKETGQFGDTHSVYLDDFTPRTGAGAREDANRHSGPVEREDIPFVWAVPFLLPALMALHTVLA